MNKLSRNMAGIKRKRKRQNKRWISWVNEAKLKCRSSLNILNGWTRNDYASRPLPDKSAYAHDITRIDGSAISLKKFERKYIVNSQPVLIDNIMNWWPAMRKWNKQFFKSSPTCQNLMFRVGEDDSGRPVRLSMKDYLRYCKHLAPQEDSPLYIFDSSFGRQKLSNTTQESSSTTRSKLKLNVTNSKLVDDFRVPEFFQQDLFDLEEVRSKRPPHRWIVIGPARSGTNLHQDPLGTSAWNALIQGRKRWILFPPKTRKELLSRQPGDDYSQYATHLDNEGITWFHTVYNKILSLTPEQQKSLRIVDFIQERGQCVYVPPGWHHVVINLDFSIAVTQNLSHPLNAEYSWLKTRNARPKFAAKLKQAIMNISKNPDCDPRCNQFSVVINSIEELKYVPNLYSSSSSDSDSSSSSSSSSQSVMKGAALSVSSTESETDTESQCNCVKCKLKRKRQRKLLDQL
ncbi:hypothetical protein MIR68_006180 [Amoeboaphelidium protococcarum]|nr:hypothetical protein MIR68_006180 [Amoeboaphelidium protococcarum]